MTEAKRVWYKALEPDELPEGRVKAVTCGLATVCMTHYEGQYAALDNACPHQRGPLGEGSIEKGFLRCPWHGWDFHPLTGKPPGGYDDGIAVYSVKSREDGIYVAFEEPVAEARTVSDLMTETMTRWGVRSVFGIVGHSNLGLAEAIRRREEAGELRYFGVRHEGAASFAASAYGKLTGRPAACFAIAGPGATNLLTGLWDANVDRAPALALTGQVDTQVLGPGAFQEVDLQAAFGKVAQWSQPVLHGSRHAELVNLALKSAILNRGVSHLIFPDEVQVLPAPEGAEAGSPEGRMTAREITPPRESLDAALALLRGSKRPVIIVGHGARFQMGPVIELAETMNAPVLTTFKGKGLIPRQPSARLRCARPQRHAHRELVHERVGRARCFRSELQQPYWHHPEEADDPGRSRPDDSRKVPQRGGPGLGRDWSDGVAATGRTRRRNGLHGSAERGRGAVGHLAGREKASRSRHVGTSIPPLPKCTASHTGAGARETRTRKMPCLSRSWGR